MEISLHVKKLIAKYSEVPARHELMPGNIAAIQTFSDRINFHPHLHFLMTDGAVTESGIFHKIPRIDGSKLVFLRDERSG